MSANKNTIIFRNSEFSHACYSLPYFVFNSRSKHLIEKNILGEKE